MKCHHPDVFCCAILNAQPMGFYAPAQLVRDARDHGVEVRPVCVNASAWDCTLEPTGRTDRHAVRLGLRTVRGLHNDHGARLVLVRALGAYASVEDAWRRAGVPVAALRRLAAADAFGPSFGLARREALWAIRALREAPLPLFAAADARAGATRGELAEEPVTLWAMTPGREVAEDYRATGLSLRGHPLAFLRADLAAERYVRCSDLERTRDGGRVMVAGLVLIRQKPGSAKGVMFITLEDETGIANLIVWPGLFERQRALVLRAGLLGCRGRVQRQGKGLHLIAEHLVDLSLWLGRVGGDEGFALATGRGDEARHGGSPDQRVAPSRSTVPSDLPLVRSRDILIPDLHLDKLRAATDAPPIQVRSRNFR